MKTNKVYPYPEFKAERTTSWEAGLNTKLFGNSLSVDLTLYKSNTYNQLLSYDLPESSTYKRLWLQAGNIENKGIEAGLGFNKTFGNFAWSSNVTYTRNINLVKELAHHYRNPINGTYFDITKVGSIREGGSMTDVITDKLLKRGADGKLVDSGKGTYEIDNTREYLIGNTAPDFTMGWQQLHFL